LFVYDILYLQTAGADLTMAFIIDLMKVGGKDILKRTWKDLSGYISLEVSRFISEL